MPIPLAVPHRARGPRRARPRPRGRQRRGRAAATRPPRRDPPQHPRRRRGHREGRRLRHRPRRDARRPHGGAQIRASSATWPRAVGGFGRTSTPAPTSSASAWCSTRDVHRQPTSPSRGQRARALPRDREGDHPRRPLRVAEYPNTLSTVVMRARARPGPPLAPTPAPCATPSTASEVQNWSVTADDLARPSPSPLDGRSIEDRWESLASTEEVTSTDAAPATDDAPTRCPTRSRRSCRGPRRPTRPTHPPVGHRPRAPPRSGRRAAPTLDASLAGGDGGRACPRLRPPPRGVPVTVLDGRGSRAACRPRDGRHLVADARAPRRARRQQGPSPSFAAAAALREVPAPLHGLFADPDARRRARGPLGRVLTGAAPGLPLWRSTAATRFPRLLRGDGEAALHVGRATDAQAAEARARPRYPVPASERPVGYDHAAVVVHPPTRCRRLRRARAADGRRVRSFHELHGNRERPVVLVGGAGSPTRAFLDDGCSPGGRRALSVAPDAVVVAHEAATVLRRRPTAAVALVRLAWVNPSVRVVPLDVPHARARRPTRDAVRGALPARAAGGALHLRRSSAPRRAFAEFRAEPRRARRPRACGLRLALTAPAPRVSRATARARPPVGCVSRVLRRAQRAHALRGVPPCRGDAAAIVAPLTRPRWALLSPTSRLPTREPGPTSRSIVPARSRPTPRSTCHLRRAPMSRWIDAPDAAPDRLRRRARTSRLVPDAAPDAGPLRRPSPSTSHAPPRGPAGCDGACRPRCVVRSPTAASVARWRRRLTPPLGAFAGRCVITACLPRAPTVTVCRRRLAARSTSAAAPTTVRRAQRLRSRQRPGEAVLASLPRRLRPGFWRDCD